MKLIRNTNRMPSEQERQNYLSHGSRNSRRNFLATSAQATAAFVMAPSLLTLLTRKAYGQSCPGPNSTASSLLPLIIFDFAGGAAFANDFVVGGVGGQMDFITGTGAYENFGIPDDLNYNNSSIVPDTSFGVAFHPSSPLMMGLKNTLPSQYWESVDGGFIAALTDDDTGNNPMGFVQYAPILGRSGLILPTIGTESNESGGRHKPAEFSQVPEYTPVRVTDQNTARRIGGFGTMFEANRLGTTRAQQVLTAVKNLSTSQLQTFANMSITEQANMLVRCGYINAVELPNLFSPDAIFPQNPAINDPIRVAFGNAFNQRTASIARLVLNEFVGAGVIERGGYDNHDGTAVNPNNIRYAAGQEIGRLIHYAALLNKPLFICGTTDGSMGVVRENGIVQVDTTAPNIAAGNVGGLGFIRKPGDNGAVSCQFFLAFVPGSTRGSIVNANRQIGAFRRGGVIPDYLVTTRNPNRVVQAMMYNYLALQGREGEITKVTGGTNPFAGPQESAYRVMKRGPGV